MPSTGHHRRIYPRVTVDMATYMRTRRVRRREQLIAILGGVCVRCGSTENLEFNHRDPIEKSFTISSGLSGKWDELLEEAQKCELLCHEHHVEETREQYRRGELRTWTAFLDEPSHGSVARYNMGCRCERCRLARRRYRVKEVRQDLGYTQSQVIA